jgi:hypothetical protein
MEKDAEKEHPPRQAGFLGFTRADFSVPPFIFAGLGAAFVSAMGAVAWGYDSRPKDISALFRTQRPAGFPSIPNRCP